MGCQTYWSVQLASEAEWEKAAKGGLELPSKPVVLLLGNLQSVNDMGFDRNPLPDRVYPWKGEFDPELANTSELGFGTTSAVGCFPAGESVYGCRELSGNVWEWTRSIRKDYPYEPGDGREDLSAVSNQTVLALRGGSFGGDRNLAHCAYRSLDYPGYSNFSVGFRVIISASPHSSDLRSKS